MKETNQWVDLNLSPFVMELLVRILCMVLYFCHLLHSYFKILRCFLLILGFVKFLGPYYMLIITKRRKIGAICGHTIYAISKSEMIPVPNPAVRSKLDNSKNENRSFVHFVCKCNMYLILLKHSKRVVFRILPCQFVVR